MIRLFCFRSPLKHKAGFKIPVLKPIDDFSAIFSQQVDNSDNAYVYVSYKSILCAFGL